MSTAVRRFNFWFETQGHWVYRNRAEAFATWKERGIEGLPVYDGT